MEVRRRAPQAQWNTVGATVDLGKRGVQDMDAEFGNFHDLTSFLFFIKYFFKDQ